MLKKRIVGVITVKDGWAVQSQGYRRYLPLGKPEWLAENLDRWGADEILLSCIDRTRGGLGPDFALLRRIGALGLSTPVVYGGGIRSVADASAVIQSGADRLCVDALLRDDPAEVQRIAAQVGAQAVIGAFPLAERDGKVQWRDYRSGADQAPSAATLALFAEGHVSEALLIDWVNEGRPGGFCSALADAFPVPKVPLILFGGISAAAQARALLARPAVAAVAVGNFLAYREHAVQALKHAVAATSLRAESYEQG